MNRVFAFRESVLFYFAAATWTNEVEPEVERNYEQRACFVESYLNHIWIISWTGGRGRWRTLELSSSS
jgi:hypothetical protein